MNRWPIKPPPPRPDGLDKKPNHDWYKKWEAEQKIEQDAKAKRTAKKKESEFETVHKKALELYEKVIEKRFPDSLLIVDPFADMYFGKDKVRGTNLTTDEFVKIKAKSRGWQRGYPDFTIVQKRGKYSGIALEFKKEGEKVFKQNGEIYSNDHLKEQFAILMKYSKQGYFARFSIGWEQTEKYLLNYFGL